MSIVRSQEIDFIKSRLNKNKDTKVIQVTETPRRHLSPEIAKLSGQISDKFNSTTFTRESRLKKSDPGYGTPQEGSLTAARGQQAHVDICVEVVDMCQVIWDHAIMSGNFDIEEDSHIACILFQDLFSVYSKISGNVVGLLQRARKYGVVQFEGETLFQGRDNMTPVFVLRNMEGVKAVFQSKHPEFKWGVIGCEN